MTYSEDSFPFYLPIDVSKTTQLQIICSGRLLSTNVDNGKLEACQTHRYCMVYIVVFKIHNHALLPPSKIVKHMTIWPSYFTCFFLKRMADCSGRFTSKSPSLFSWLALISLTWDLSEMFSSCSFSKSYAELSKKAFAGIMTNNKTPFLQSPMPTPRHVCTDFQNI